jgi:hypothetical protein
MAGEAAGGAHLQRRRRARRLRRKIHYRHLQLRLFLLKHQRLMIGVVSELRKIRKGEKRSQKVKSQL